MFITKTIRTEAPDMATVIESFNADMENMLAMDFLATKYQDEYFGESAAVVANEATFEEIKNKLSDIVSNALTRLRAYGSACYAKAEKAAKAAKAKVTSKNEDAIDFEAFMEASGNESIISTTTAKLKSAVDEALKALNGIAKGAVKNAKDLATYISTKCASLKEFISSKISSKNEDVELSIYSEAGDERLIDKLLGAIRKGIDKCTSLGGAALEKAKGMLGSVKPFASKMFHKAYAAVVTLINKATQKAQKVISSIKF
jgi:hypothetical protein|nr:MAG TPA: hypothetical protein [Caudoviricetes sp.]DAV28932.1 MAG TPA: hypothetical protein [Caudoviricetes sp.]